MIDSVPAVRVTVLGARGSVPVSGENVRRYGGSTSCYMVEAGGEYLVLDAGTGIVKARVPGDGPVHILLSHPHADHVIGLPMMPALTEKGREVHLWGEERGGRTVEEQLALLISPPLWPVTLAEYPADVRYHTLSFPLRLGRFEVDGMAACHPGGSTVLRVRACGKTLVYATDFEHTAENLPLLAEFSREADLLLYDAQYTPEEYARRRGFGHSTAEAGMEIARLGRVRRLVLVHHDPRHDDSQMEALERLLGARYAREGEVIEL